MRLKCRSRIIQPKDESGGTVMARGKMFQVKNSRFQFICGECKAKRHLPVPPNTRRRSVRCHKCGTTERCLLNRRAYVRERQSGKVTMILKSGRELSADLYDISSRGLGCEVHPKEARLLTTRQEVKFKCTWNPMLVERNRYVIKTIQGNRVGLINLTPKIVI